MKLIMNIQVNLAWNLIGTKNQWVDYGIHTEACITRPEYCSVAGGAISLWVNANACDSRLCGIISSRKSYKSGFVLMMVYDLR